MRNAIGTGLRDAIVVSLTETKKAAIDLQTSAPTPPGRGWNAAEDPQAMAAMRDAWRRMRASFELYSAAMVVLFPDVMRGASATYDQALGSGDGDAFDDQGVVGMHAVERILYSDAIPARVVDFEKGLPGFAPAAFPSNAQQASDFKTKLCARLVADIARLEKEWSAVDLDFGGAFLLLVALLQDQRIEMEEAALRKEESRYAQTTLAELRTSLEGTRRAYAFFKPLLLEKRSADEKTDGAKKSESVEVALGALGAVYASQPGDALPELPPKWAATGSLTASELETPFAIIYRRVQAAADATVDGALADELNDMIEILGFPELRAAE